MTSTCTLIPTSRSQVILTSIYLSKKVTWFKGLLHFLFVSLQIQVPSMCALTNSISFRPSKALCYLAFEPLTVLCLESSMPFPLRSQCRFHFLWSAFPSSIIPPYSSHLPRTARCPLVYNLILFS